MANFKELVGKRIRAKREALGYSTQAALAKAIGVDRTRVAKWEAGNNLPTGELKATLLRLLNTSESELFTIDVPPPASPATIAEMTPAEMEALVARASKRDGSINLELEKLRKREKPIKVIADAWESRTPEIKAACLFFATEDETLVSFLPNEVQEALAAVLRLLQSVKTKE